MKKASGLGRSDGGCRGMADVRQGRKRVGAQVLGEGRWGFSGGVNCGQCRGRRAAGLKLRLVQYSGRRSVGPYCRGIGCASGGGAVAGQMCVWAPFDWPVTWMDWGWGLGGVGVQRCGGGVCGCGCARKVCFLYDSLPSRRRILANLPFSMERGVIGVAGCGGPAAAPITPATGWPTETLQGSGCRRRTGHPSARLRCRRPHRDSKMREA